MSTRPVTGAVTSVAPSGAAGGDLSGTYPNPKVVKVEDGSGHVIVDGQSKQILFTNSVAAADWATLGIVQFLNGSFTMDNNGDLYVGRYITSPVTNGLSIDPNNQILYDSNFNEALSWIGPGQINFYNGIASVDDQGVFRGFFLGDGSRLSPVQSTLNTGSTVTFSIGRISETVYNNSSSVVGSLTINLPSGAATSVTGQMFRYVTKSGATLVSVTGTVSIGAAVTTLPANSSVAWQAIDLVGTWVRIQ